jgi:hypothetical protein
MVSAPSRPRLDAPRALLKLEVAGRDYTHVARALDRSPRLALLRARHTAQALTHLFGAEHLPGDSAQDRLHFVLAYLDQDGLPTRLRLGATGFRAELVRHEPGDVLGPAARLLAAAARAYALGPVRRRLVGPRELAAVEALGDPARSATPMLGRPGLHEAALAALGDREPEVLEYARQASLSPLTVYGWALGCAIRDGALCTATEVAAWLEAAVLDPRWPRWPPPVKTW